MPQTSGLNGRPPARSDLRRPRSLTQINQPPDSAAGTQRRDQSGGRTGRRKDLTMATPATAHGAHDHGAHDHPTGWRRFVYSTNHKDIGTMYLAFALLGGLIGGLLSICIWRRRLASRRPP